jgi:hypothetical protein
MTDITVTVVENDPVITLSDDRVDVNVTESVVTITDGVLTPTAIRWSPNFQATGMTFTGTDTTYPTYNSYFVKAGQLVSFWIAIEFATVTNFGTGQYKVDMPFPPVDSTANHFSAWCWVNPALPPDDLNGHIQLVADHMPGEQTLDFHWLQATTSNPKPIIETLLSQGNPVTFTTASKMYVNGTYITES